MHSLIIMRNQVRRDQLRAPQLAGGLQKGQIPKKIVQSCRAHVLGLSMLVVIIDSVVVSQSRSSSVATCKGEWQSRRRISVESRVQMCSGIDMSNRSYSLDVRSCAESIAMWRTVSHSAVIREARNPRSRPESRLLYHSLILHS